LLRFFSLKKTKMATIPTTTARKMNKPGRKLGDTAAAGTAAVEGEGLTVGAAEGIGVDVGAAVGGGV